MPQAAPAVTVLNDLIGRIGAVETSEDLMPLRERLGDRLGEVRWVPNPGPQTQAWFCQADELFYGGSAGGGKSDLTIGLAMEEHEKSLVLRRFNSDAEDLAERMLEVLGTREGFNGQSLRWRDTLRQIDFGGCRDEKDKQRFKGKPHDLISFDEIGDFLEAQFRFIIGWNRSVNPVQRCRVVCTGNPPTTPEGLWVIKYWAAWLDPKHPRPAKDGELRWYTTGEDGKDIEVDGIGPHLINGEEVEARSRTFIRGKLEDNPDLTQTNDYAARLAALPAEYRAAYRDGSFEASMQDHAFQTIPTHWVQQAMERWTEHPPLNVPMCAMALDPAQGGADDNVIAKRYDGWFAPLVVIPGSETPVGSDCAGKVVIERRDSAVVVVDCDGGYGGTPIKTLKENEIPCVAYKGSEKSVQRTDDKTQVRFANQRAEAHWRLREALDPAQEWGSPIILPDDPELLADLTASTFQIGPRGVQIELKEKIRERIGRSPGKGDAVIMCWSEGQKQITHLCAGDSAEMGRGTKRRPRVVHGHQSVRNRGGKG